MTTNQPTTLAECVPILVAAGCPEPKKNLVWSEADQQYRICAVDIEGNRRTIVDDSLVNAALESWVMGVVVPWFNTKHEVSRMFLPNGHLSIAGYSCTVRFAPGSSGHVVGHRKYPEFTLALTVAICGVIGEVKA